MASDELQAIIELLRAQPVIDADFPARRANMEAATGIWPLPEGATAEPVDAGGVPCEWVAMPGVATDRAVLYVHGGAYTTGSLVTHRRHVAQLSGGVGRAGPQRRLPAGPGAPAPGGGRRRGGGVPLAHHHRRASSPAGSC